MSLPPRWRRVSSLLALSMLAGCATVASIRSERQGAMNRVTVDEPPAPPGPPVPGGMIEEPTPEHDLVLAASRLVANDGQLHRDPRLGQAWWQGGPCAPSLLIPAPSPLDDGGMYHSVAPRTSIGGWVAIGLDLSVDATGVLLFGGPCGRSWRDQPAGARITRLAPDVAGRDSSVLFSTSRAGMPAPAAGASVAGGLVREMVRLVGGEPPPRTAKPRPAEAAPPAPSAAPEHAPAPRETRERGARPPGRSSRPGM